MMRKGTQYLWRLIACLIIISVFPLPSSYGEEITGSVIAEVTTERGPLTLRRDPKRSAKALAKLERGSYITVLESGEEWSRVDDGTHQGYVLTQYLTIWEDADARLLNYRPLQYGDRGDEVIALKQRLMELGYLRANSKLTNLYNNILVQRLKMFQKQNGLEEDGVATPRVQLLLFSEDAKKNTERLPAPATHYLSDSSSSSSSDDDWKKVVCDCCYGEGCVCCDYTGWVWVPSYFQEECGSSYATDM